MASHKLKALVTYIKGNALLLLILELFIASFIIQKHNGFIDFESEKGMGA